MRRFISPEEHLQTEDIQKQIKSYYYGCSEFTDNGKLCRPSFNTNKLINPYTKKKIDCNWYCLRNCSPKKLLPIFKNIPKYIIDKDGDGVPVTNIEFQFEPEITPKPTLKISIRVSEPYWIQDAISWKYEPSWEWKDYRHYRKEISRNVPWEGKGTDFNILAEQVCQWFKSQDPDMDISLKCEVMASSQNFSRFDTPFLRPVSEWNSSDTGGVITKFIINKSVSPQTQEPTLAEPSVSPWENLPVGLLGEDAEPLSSYGIAHPDIHRVSRKYRKASHHRPRHFHSPTRKEVVSRKSRHRK